MAKSPHGSHEHSGNVFPVAPTPQTLGATYLDVTGISAPSNPSSGVRRVFVDSGSGELSVRTSGGSTVSLESGGSGVPTSRAINTTAPLTGGGDLSADRTIAIPQANGSTDGFLDSADWTTFNNKVGTSRTINTTSPLSGGGDLSADRTIALGTVPEGKGGTNQTTYTTGDILYASGADTLAKLAIGSAGQVLTVASGVPSWAAASGGSSVDAYEDGASVINAITRIDFKDSNVENPSGTIATVYHNLPGVCDGRLTLTTGVPVTTSDVSAAGTLYFTPYMGDKVSLWDGTRWKIHTFTERSLSLSGLATGVNYDIFLYDNSGTLTLEAKPWGVTLGSTTYNRSNFTGSDGTDLSSYTPDTGGAWTEHAGDFDIVSNKAEQQGGTDPSLATVQSSQTDVAVSVVVDRAGTTSGIGIVLRYQDTSNYWLIDCDDTQIQIFEVNGGSFTSRASAAISNSGGTLLASCVGNSIMATLDTASCVYESSFLNTQTRHGIKGSADNQTFDTFIVGNPASGTTRVHALGTRNGVYVLNSDNTRRYLGTIRTSASAATEDSVTKRFVWNNYNRLRRRLKRTDTTDSYASTNSNFHDWLNNSANKVEFVRGLDEDYVYLRFGAIFGHSSTGTAGIGIGLDSSSTNSADLFPQATSALAATYTCAEYMSYPGIGYHYLQLLEKAASAGTTTYFGDSGVTWLQNGAVGYLMG